MKKLTIEEAKAEYRERSKDPIGYLLKILREQIKIE